MSVGESMASRLPNNSAAALVSFLPRSPLLEYKKNEVIYSPANPPLGIYFVAKGMVKLIRRRPPLRREVVIDVYLIDDLFGESTFLNSSEVSEEAVALEPTALMVWPTAEVETIMAGSTKASTQLFRLLSQRAMDRADRLTTLAACSAPERVAQALIHFSESLGTRTEDDSVCMRSFTHELLAQYVGTTREGVTTIMNQFRTKGYISYSRSRTIIRPGALLEWLSLNQ